MKSFKVKRIHDIEFDEIPMEVVTFDASSNRVSIKADSSTEMRVSVEFQQVESFSYSSVDDYEMEMFCVGDFFTPSIYEAVDETGDRVSRRFFLPTQDGVWEIRSSAAPSVESSPS